ncbi:3-hydroxybutyryl-CoA dehydrogenase [Actinoplanes teichomyceticus]|uniref:3-hydroxybutyryl-CoA dehydrogenase n=1 Tax=Actinoplanes teichomyceticus TaxID=1867 RepID=A0A561WBI9_ACTTI|nr:3-hydroxybutyryl-CoA dehydrogenase [Actinoplanes teichomyceticus]TWG21205.1 3-hydroxybutyryl-CoA dehydrogenase [Actinoplanes teichomyceticus]GIF15026.1 3-hydroxybutyryl-CoA dehydrogenase [Actinoplanes teichomyceticus]
MTAHPSRVGVVGCGTMGAGIAEVCLRAGLDVRVAVSSAAGVRRAADRMAGQLDRAVAKGRMSGAERARSAGRLRVVAGLDELADRQLVIEAVTEDAARKRRVFEGLDAVLADPGAILATTTSSLLVSDLAGVTGRAGAVVGMHFFNPVPAMPLVEVVRTGQTDPATVARATAFVTQVLGKQAIGAGDRRGFVVNALLVPYLVAAVRMVEDGVAAPADIDRGMTLGCGHPMGPLALLDMIGIDTFTAVAEGLVAEVPATLRRMTAEGRLGRKSGEGFFRYDRTPAPEGAS